MTYGDSSIDDFSGDATYDAATANWDSTWRMPTQDEYQELIDECTWTWTTQKNSDSEAINGYVVEGNNGNSIFLPAAGNIYYASLAATNSWGSYWSSSPYSSNNNKAYYLYVGSSSMSISSFSRIYGLSVRPVSE